MVGCRFWEAPGFSAAECLLPHKCQRVVARQTPSWNARLLQLAGTHPCMESGVGPVAACSICQSRHQCSCMHCLSPAARLAVPDSIRWTVNSRTGWAGPCSQKGPTSRPDRSMRAQISSAGAQPRTPQSTSAQATAARTRRFPVSAEASCLSLGHFLELSLAACHLSLHGTQLHGSCARFFGTGTTVACFHEVRMVQVCSLSWQGCGCWA